MNTTIGARFSQLIEVKGLTTNAFANSLGKPYTSIKVIIDGVSKPGYDLLERVLQTYPDVSPEWLMKGEGEVLLNSQLNKPLDGGAFGNQVVEKMATELIEQRRHFEQTIEDLRKTKDSLQRMLELQLGKPKGSTRRRPVSTQNVQLKLPAMA